MKNVFENINKETVIKGLKTAGKVVAGGVLIALTYAVGFGDGTRKQQSKTGTDDPEMLSEPETIEVTDFEEKQDEEESEESEESA